MKYSILTTIADGRFYINVAGYNWDITQTVKFLDSNTPGISLEQKLAREKQLTAAYMSSIKKTVSEILPMRRELRTVLKNILKALKFKRAMLDFLSNYQQEQTKPVYVMAVMRTVEVAHAR